MVQSCFRRTVRATLFWFVTCGCGTACSSSAREDPVDSGTESETGDGGSSGGAPSAGSGGAATGGSASSTGGSVSNTGGSAPSAGGANTGGSMSNTGGTATSDASADAPGAFSCDPCHPTGTGGPCTEGEVVWLCDAFPTPDEILATCRDAATGLVRYCCPYTFGTHCPLEP